MADTADDFLDFDVSGVDHEVREPSGDFVTPKVGLYVLKIRSAEQQLSKAGNPQIVLTYGIALERTDKDAPWTEPEANYGQLWDYVGLTPNTKWKLDQFLQAIGINTKSTERGRLRLSDQVGKLVLGRIKHEMYDGAAQAKIASVWQWEDPADQAIASGIDVDEDDEPDVPDDVHPIFTDPFAGMGEADIDALKKDGLKELADKAGLDIKGKKVGEVKQLLKDELDRRQTTANELADDEEVREMESDEDDDDFGF